MITINKQVKVLDEFGDPISNAHVYISSNSGTTTNSQGYARITGDSYATVKISYVGKGEKNYPLKDLPEVVTLYENFDSLDEVLITAKPKISGTPNYIFPALGAAALLLVLMSLGGNEPKKVVL